MTQNARPFKLDEIRSQFWMNDYHLKGAAGLLQIRQQQGYPQNLALEKGVRRVIVRRFSVPGFLN